MGASYGSILIRTANAEEVHQVLEKVAKESDCRFLVGPLINGWLSIFPNNSGQNDSISAEITELLQGDIFHFIVHDDDVFIYLFYRGGRLIDRYNSCPDYFHEVPDEEKQQCLGRPERFRDLFSTQESLSEFTDLLRADEETYVFEQERMSKAVQLLGFSNALSSYEYLQAGERDGIRNWRQFIHIPDLTEEKHAKRVARGKLNAEKKRLQKEGILLAEIVPPKVSKRQLPGKIAWGTDSRNGGILFTKQNFHFGKAVDDPQSAVEFCSLGPPWNAPLQPLKLKTNWTAHVFSMSPSAAWLAGGFVSGDWKMRVWDWRRKVLAFEVPHTQAVEWVGFSRDEQWVYSLGGEEFIVSSMAEKCPVITVKGMGGARSAAVHPSGKFAVVAFQDRLGIIDLEKKELITRLWISRRKETLDLFGRNPDAFVHTCLKEFLEHPNIREKLGVNSDVRAAIIQDPTAIELLDVQTQQALKSMIEKVRERSRIFFEAKEQPFDVRFHPDGESLFVASNGMRVFNWSRLLSASEDAPLPEHSVDAPRDDENDPNSRPLAYCVQFDPDRNVLLSSCLAGVVQYLKLANGEAGTLFKPPGEMTIWRLELTSDRQGLCCHCGIRPRVDLNNRFICVQVWNYPALCRAAGLG